MVAVTTVAAVAMETDKNVSGGFAMLGVITAAAVGCFYKKSGNTR